MAAGIGSRYGTLKQIDRIGPSGETIIDYSVYDAIRAGFGKVVFIIRREFEKDFRDIVLKNLERNIALDLVFQELTDVPVQVDIPEERVKPWGTGHAIWSARKKIDGPFAVINADDFYGAQSFRQAYEFLSNHSKKENSCCLIGYLLKNTLSEHGYVSRAECQVSSGGFLINTVERSNIKREQGKIHYKDNACARCMLDDDTIVSMNFWGFRPSLFKYLEEHFKTFLVENAMNPRSEFLIPTVINNLIKSNTIEVTVIHSASHWFGMTYREDRELVREKISRLVNEGIYPDRLWN